MTREEIRDGVKACLAEVLECSAEGIREEDRLVGELGADSLDLLDLTFHLEQRFKVSLSPRDMERRAREVLGATPLEIDGVYTQAALLHFRAIMPEVPAAEIDEGLAVGQLPRVFRVATMINLLARLLEERDPGTIGHE